MLRLAVVSLARRKLGETEWEADAGEPLMPQSCSVSLGVGSYHIHPRERLWVALSCLPSSTGAVANAWALMGAQPGAASCPQCPQL